MTESVKRELARIVHELSVIVQHSAGHRTFALFRSSRNLPLVYAPRFRKGKNRDGNLAASAAPVALVGPSGASAAVLEPGASVSSGADRSHLPANMRCSYCPERIYGVRRYLIEGRLPVLFLRYNYPLDEKSAAVPDRSAKHLFATQDEEDLFLRMLSAARLDPADLYFQEFPACHFDPRSLPEDWNRRTRNCLEHVQATVKERGIRQILVTGNAAVLLFGDRAAQLAEKGESVLLDLLDPPVPCLVLRSPAALLAMERQRTGLEKLLERFPEEAGTYQMLKGKPLEFRQWADQALASIPSEETSGENSSEDGVRVIASIKLRPASSIQSRGPAKADGESERFRRAGREGAGLLFRLQRLRENEAKVKRQVLDALSKIHGNGEARNGQDGWNDQAGRGNEESGGESPV